MSVVTGSPPPRPGVVSAPVNLPASAFKVRLYSRSGAPLRPGWVHFQVPFGSTFWSCAWTATAPSAKIAQTPAARREVRAFDLLCIFISLFGYCLGQTLHRSRAKYWLRFRELRRPLPEKGYNSSKLLGLDSKSGARL